MEKDLQVEINDDLIEWCTKHKGEDNDYERHSAAMRARELYQLVKYFNLTLPLDVSTLIGDLMTNRLFF